MARVLVIEDDRSILTGLLDILKSEGFEVLSARDGQEGLKLGLRADVDLVVLDIRLPKLDGFELCRRLREDRLAVPILMLTAKTQEADKVLGLGLGADDYLTKPFGVAEFVARVKALLRRVERVPGDDGLRTFAFGGISVDFQRYRASRSGKEIPLTAREFAVLGYLVRRRGKVVTRDELLREVWEYEALPVTRTVDAHIMQLRKKLERNPSKPRHIQSVHSVGYPFEG